MALAITVLLAASLVARARRVDPAAHVVAGDILSPGNTTPAAEAMIAWIAQTLAP